MRILGLTNLYPNPLHPHRAMFNRQEFRSLANRHEVAIISPIAWTDEFRASRRGLFLWSARSRVDEGGISVVHPRYLFPPLVLRRWYGASLLSSVRNEFERSVARFRPEIVYAPWAYPDGWAAVRLGLEAGLPVVLKVHGSDIRLVDRHPGRLEGTREAVSSADAVVAVSRDLANRVVDLGADQGRVRTIYGGIDTTLFRPGPRDEARARLGLTPDGPVLLFVGNLVPVKGIDVLIRACARLVSDGLRPVCYLIGQGPMGPELDRLARRMGVGDRVHRIGPRPLESLPEWYRAADVLALPSHSEGVPSVLVEASACGTPYVASRVGGIPEIAHIGRGRLVPPGDADAVALAIREVLDDPRPRIKTSLDYRTYDDVADELTGLFKQVVGRYHRTQTNVPAGVAR